MEKDYNLRVLNSLFINVGRGWLIHPLKGNGSPFSINIPPPERHGVVLHQGSMLFSITLMDAMIRTWANESSRTFNGSR